MGLDLAPRTVDVSSQKVRSMNLRRKDLPFRFFYYLQCHIGFFQVVYFILAVLVDAV